MRTWISAALAAGLFGFCASAVHAACNNSDESCVGSVLQAPYPVESRNDGGAPASLLGFQSGDRASARNGRFRRGAERQPYSNASQGKSRRAPARMEEKAPPSNENFPVRLFESRPEDARAEMPAAEAPAEAAQPLLTTAVTAPPQPLAVVPSNEINDLDRAAGPPQPAAQAQAETGSAFAFLAGFAESLGGNSGDGGTSTVGRMFIGLGALLTAATALRLILA